MQAVSSKIEWANCLTLKNKAEFIIVMLNDGAFGQPAALMMHAQNSIMRAVEFNIPVIRTANTGLSGTIDAAGLMTGEGTLPINTAGTLQLKVSRRHLPSIYAKFGDIFSVLCILFVIMTSVVHSDVILKKVRRNEIH